MDFVPKLYKGSPLEIQKTVAKDVSVIRGASKSHIKVMDGQLDLHPGYPILSLDPSKIATAGETIDREVYILYEFYLSYFARGGNLVHNQYTHAIGASLPKKGIMLLNREGAMCVIHHPAMKGFSIAGIRYGGNEWSAESDGGSQNGYLQSVPVTLQTVPIGNYGITQADKLHRLGTIIGGANVAQWDGRYFAAHFVMGLFLEDLYHGEHTHLVTIGNPYFDTSKGHLPHSHYNRVREEPLRLEGKIT